MRVFMALLLSLILGLASQTEAVARSEMAGAQAQELCGAGRVLLDASGQVIHGQSCTHCLAASVSASLDAAAALPVRPMGRITRLRPHLAQTQVPQAAPQATARAPPVSLS